MCTVSKVLYRISIIKLISVSYRNDRKMILLTILFVMILIDFFLLNACFVFHFYIIWKIMVTEFYYTVC